MRGILLYAGVALAAKHQIFVGNLFTPATIHAVEFDDVTHEFRKAASQPAHSSHAWLALSVSASDKLTHTREPQSAC